MTWTRGRLLTSLKKNLSGGVVNTVSYSYNSDGVRIGKVVNGVAVEYVLNGTQILAEKNGDHIICYFYDAQGLPVAFSVSMGFWSIDSDNNFSCSVSGGVHIIAGVSFSVGFNSSEFIERLFD